MLFVLEERHRQPTARILAGYHGLFLMAYDCNCRKNLLLQEGKCDTSTSEVDESSDDIVGSESEDPIITSDPLESI